MLRTERPGDMLPVYELVSAAFGRPDEAELVNRLRECGAAVVTMVEEEEYEFMGHLMLSPITIDGQEGPWLGLAPVAVHPDWQGQGIGSDLVREGLDTALEMDWKAVVVLGDPAYYGRFGFRPASLSWASFLGSGLIQSRLSMPSLNEATKLSNMAITRGVVSGGRF